MTKIRIRQAILAAMGAVLLAVSVFTLLAPEKNAAQLGYGIESIAAKNEFRAVYFGVFLAISGLCFLAAKRTEEPLLGDLAALIVLGHIPGRITGFLLDGIPDSPVVWTNFAAELIGPLVILLLRTGKSAKGVSQ